MLIARAPLRISFAGGGTDLEAYYAKHGGVVVSATINKYFYVFLSRTIDDSVQITSSDFRMFERRAAGEELSSDGDLGYLKAILQEFGVRRGLSVFTACEIPPGTGLGSSSTVAVALVKALATLCQRRASKQEVAELASYIEIVKQGRPIGLQDQFAASFGGLNCIHFESTGATVTPLRLSMDVRSRLERSILLFFTGSSRNAATILTEQRQASLNEDPDVIENLHGIASSATRWRCGRRSRRGGCGGWGRSCTTRGSARSSSPTASRPSGSTGCTSRRSSTAPWGGSSPERAEAGSCCSIASRKIRPP